MVPRSASVKVNKFSFLGKMRALGIQSLSVGKSDRAVEETATNAIERS